MSKYKLIKSYPGSPVIGCIAEKHETDKIKYTNPNDYTWVSGESFVTIILSNPDFWERSKPVYTLVINSITKEILSASIIHEKGFTQWKIGDFTEQGMIAGFRVNHSEELEYTVYQGSTALHYSLKDAVEVEKKDYEILRISHTFGENGSALSTSKPQDIAKYLSDPNTKILSIKRLSDGEVFSVGDKVRNPGYISYWVINSIKIQLDKLYVYSDEDSYYCPDFSKLQKSKIPLFTTEDGVDIFEGDKFYGVDNLNRFISYVYTGNAHNCKTLNTNFKWFSTKEAAMEYVYENRAILSLSELDRLGYINHKDFKLLKQYVKDKLCQKK